ncbi:hypothetical protein FACS189460_0910 [Deltaproteobacteria bacterium]|nr:hypothetical protein FACS189460_0910 [Deltaproteobacteria bacterium]
MLFNFAKMEAIEEELQEEVEPVTEESPVDNLDVTDEVKEEIKEIIEEAVEEVAEVITEGEAASDEVEETTTQIEETVEQVESLMLLYNVIQEHGVSAPIVKLIDANGSFRKAVGDSNPSVSFESLSSTPDFGELKVACENKLMESIKSGAKTLWELIQKCINSITENISKFVNYVKNVTAKAEATQRKLQQAKTLVIKENNAVLSKEDFMADTIKISAYLDAFRSKNTSLEISKLTEENYKETLDALFKNENKEEYNFKGSGSAKSAKWDRPTCLEIYAKGLLPIISKVKNLKTYADSIVKTMGDIKKFAKDKDDDTKKDAKTSVKAAQYLLNFFNQKLYSMPNRYISYWISVSNSVASATPEKTKKKTEQD